MTSLSPILEYKEETSAAATRLEAAERLRRHEVDLDASQGLPDRPWPLRTSTPLPMLGDSTILSAFGQSVELSPGWMWNSHNSGIQQPTDDLSSSVESDSTVLMASLDISWVSGSLDLDHASPEPSADGHSAPYCES